jgi:hypothetical protein
MSDVTTLREALHESRARLFAPIEGLSEEQFRHSVDDDGWNIATHLAHLLRCERMLAERSMRALREDGARVLSTGVTNDDDPALAQRLAVPQVIHGLQASRREVASMLDGTADASLDRAIEHERLGRISVREMVEKMAAHEDEHAQTIELLARRSRSAQRVTIPLNPRS